MKVETHINNSVSKKFRIKTLCLLMMCSYSALAIDTDGQNITADPQEIKQIQNQISVDTSNSGRRLGNGYDSVSLDLKSHTVVFVSPKADGTLPSPTAAPTLLGNSEAF
ncbi:MAG: hypothetical protein HRT35_34805, partial [Algicola sp.]|nr:hypothetical protein [Algicola sp.]